MSAPAPFKVLPVEHKTDGIFEELKEVQRKFEYLPADELKRIATGRGLALRDVHAAPPLVAPRIAQSHGKDMR